MRSARLDPPGSRRGESRLSRARRRPCALLTVLFLCAALSVGAGVASARIAGQTGSGAPRTARTGRASARRAHCRRQHHCHKPPRSSRSGGSSGGKGHPASPGKSPSGPGAGSTAPPSEPEAPASGAPAEETPASSVPSEPPKEEAPAKEPPKKEAPKEEPPRKEAPKEEKPKEEPRKEPPKEEKPKEEAPAEPLRLFSAESIYNQALPASAPLASNSSQLVSAFQAQVSRYYGHVVINTTEWSTPVYVVGAGAPTYALVGESSICPRPEGVFSGFQAQIEAVPIPASAEPAAGTDKEMVIWQPSTGHLWELWRVLQEGGHWTACWGGEIADAHTSDGLFPAPYGASASGLSLLGGQIHLEDLEHGAIDHALELLMPDTLRSQFVWPANRTDGESEDADSIPEGTRFRLNPSLDLSTLHLSKPALEIATAIQRYGMILGDTAGSVALSAQDPTPLMREGKADPYDTLLGGNTYELLNAVPWSQLQVVSSTYHG
ncbi:MAG TPA: hypothetical protein VGY13_03790 [Solirubrobacteraceae bacterium]|jgi:hypothetical protein|nr:hypothetical protein [Solirubrobacteraceae bacterium]